MRWSKTLSQAISKGHSQSVTIKRGARLFQILENKYHYAVVDKVLAWYCQHRGEEFCPYGDTAYHFRANFGKIRQAMEVSDDVEVSQRNKDLAESLINNYKYPVEIASKLPMILQQTRNGWEIFCHRMAGYVEPPVSTRPPNDRYIAFMIRVLELHALVFVDNWGLYLHQRYGFMESYTGNTANLVWRSASTAFKESFWRKWSQEYCADAGAFDSLLAELIGR